MYYLEYTERIKGKLVKKHEYVAKKNVKVLRQKIRRTKARYTKWKQQYQHFIREVPHITKCLERDSFDIPDIDAWEALNLLRTETPSFSKFPLSLLEQIAVMRVLLNLADAIPNYFDRKIEVEEKLLATECQVAIDLLNDLSYDLWEY